MSSNQVPPKDSHSISLEVAVEMTTLYRENRPAILKPEYSTDILALNESFNKEDVLSLLEENGCAGLRIYYGMSPDLNIHAILVGVNEAGEDILPDEKMLDAIILEDSRRCPVECPPDSVLNS